MFENLHVDLRVQPNLSAQEPADNGEPWLQETIALTQRVVATYGSVGSEPFQRALYALTEALKERSVASVRVASLLVAQGASCALCTAVLLGPLRARNLLSEVQLVETYGVDVAKLVEEAVRITPLRVDTEEHRHEDCALLLRSTASDFRVLIVRVAMRIVDLEAPCDGSFDDLRQLATEGRELLAPLADRIGLGVLRGRLEDACFRVLEPDDYERLDRAAAAWRQADEMCLRLLTEKFTALMRRYGMSADVRSRTKSLWSIFTKMRRHGLPFERIRDRLGVRVIVTSVPDCYTVVGILHRLFRPIDGTVRDYIALPKANGYQSIHSCVYPPREISANPVEFQIRTREMHAEAEFGAAAHWLYKSPEERTAEQLRQQLWFQDVVSYHARLPVHATFVEALERLAYQQDPLVLLPGGEQLRVPTGFTVGDLLLQRLGENQAIETVRVNSLCCTLDTLLRDGDTVEWTAAPAEPKHLEQASVDG